MALFKLNPAAIGERIGASAASKAAMAVAQKVSPKLIKDVQNVIGKAGVIGGILGIKTGISAIDGLLGLNDPQEGASDLLGGLSLKQAQTMYEQVKAARVARKNLFFIRITDLNPPNGDYRSKGASAPGGALITNPLSLAVSRIGAGLNSIADGVTNAVGSIVGDKAGSFVGGLAAGVKDRLGIGSGGSDNSIGRIALDSFDILAMDVSYGSSLISEVVQVGSGFIDQPTGRNPVEMQITTMDDEAGTLKRWFEGKLNQVAHLDGTFGVPAEYLVNIEVVHAIPSPDVANAHLAYSSTFRMRAHTSQFDLSRRDQALAEVQMTFTQFDSFMGL